MRYLGLDLGSKTLGISISDERGLLASAYKTIRHNEEYDLLVEEVVNIVKENKIGKIILGLPKNMNNTLGVKGELSILFKKKINAKIDTEVVLEDERLTTMEANKILIRNDASRKKRKKIIDNVAASIILQGYLDRINNKGE